jgi:hypothetical protein
LSRAHWGMLFHGVRPGQIERTITGVLAAAEGKAGPQTVLFGAPPLD